MAKVSRKIPDQLKWITDHIVQGTKTIAQVRIPGGVIGKIATVLVFFLIALAFIVRAVPQATVAILAISVATAIVLVMVPLMVWFAHRNPQSAILEGAEFVIHQQLNKLGTKANPLIIDDARSRSDPEANPPLPAPEALKVIEMSPERDGGDNA